MSTESEKIIFSRLSGFEQDLHELRQSFLATNQQYHQVLSSLKDLTNHATEAAIRASSAADKALATSKLAAEISKNAKDKDLIEAADKAVEAARESAESAIEAAAAAAAASAAAAVAAAHQAEEVALGAAAQAAQATKRATDAAASAVKIANEAAAYVKKR